MAAVKPLLAIMLVVGLWSMWSYRDPVLAAYTEREETEVLQLRGLNLDHELTDVGPSPFWLPVATDTRDRQTPLTPIDDRSRPAEPATVIGGDALLGGTVYGPTGPVAGAVVRVERHGSSGTASSDVATNADGAWEIKGLVGGRYRVWAWAMDGLAMERSEVLFLPDGSGQRLDLQLNAVSSQPRAAFTVRGDVYLGLTATVAVSLTTHTVGDDGIVEIAPVVDGPVTVGSAPGFTVTPAVATTDGEGVARFTVRCHRVGSGSTEITYGPWRGSASLPDCVPLPVPPTTTTTTTTAPVPPPTLEGGAPAPTTTAPPPPPPEPPSTTVPPEPRQQSVHLTRPAPVPTVGTSPDPLGVGPGAAIRPGGGNG